MPWGSKAHNAGSNDYSCADPNGESKDRPYEAGVYYGGNSKKNAQANLADQGSRSAEVNQGILDESYIPTTDEGGDMGQNNEFRLKEQGSHAQLGYRDKKVSRELKRKV